MYDPKDLTNIEQYKIVGKNERESCSSTFGACYGQCIYGLVCNSNIGCGKCVKPSTVYLAN